MGLVGFSQAAFLLSPFNPSKGRSNPFLEVAASAMGRKSQERIT